MKVVSEDSSVSIRYMLSADACIQIIENSPITLLQRLAQCRAGEIGVSAITVAELSLWAAHSRTFVKTNEALRHFLQMLPVLYFDESAATIYGTTKIGVEQTGATMETLDVLIAAHAISLNATYVTDRNAVFEGLKKLRTEDWSR